MKILFGVFIVCGLAYGYYDDYFRKLDSLTPEEPCSRNGGICTFAADCRKPTPEKGLCPSQRSLGVECCYGLSIRETRCVKNGGQCFPPTRGCNKKLIFDRATDCNTGEVCCILVR